MNCGVGEKGPTLFGSTSLGQTPESYYLASTKSLYPKCTTLKINIFNEKSDKNSSHVELHYYIIRRRIASDGNNIARAVRVSETEAAILLE